MIQRILLTNNCCIRLFLAITCLMLLGSCSKSKRSLSEKAFKKLHTQYSKEADNTDGTTNEQVTKWINGYWDLRHKYPNTIGAAKGNVEAYRIAVRYKAIAALDTLFYKTSINDDAMATILSYLPYTPIYADAILKLHEIKRESKNAKVQASALLQIAKIHQNHRRYGQVAVILDSLSNQYNITNSHPKFGREIKNLRDNIDKFSVEQKLNDFKTTTIDGRQISSQDFEDQVTLIYFYNTGCGSCVAFLPTLNKLFEKYKSKKLQILGVSADGPYMTQEKFRDEIKEHKVKWPQSLDISLFTKYKIKRISTVFLIDQNQELVLTAESENVTQAIPSLTDLSLEDAIRNLLKI